MSIVRVGGGRGFVVETRGERYVITAAHCLPSRCDVCETTLPVPHAANGLNELTYANLIGPLGDEPTVWAACVFADPVADIAVLSSPDNQALSDESDAYEALTDGVEPLRVAELPTGGVAPSRMLSLKGEWYGCDVQRFSRCLWVTTARGIAAGMSGSPILDSDGRAVGVVSVAEVGGTGGHGPNPSLACLPAWLLRELS